MQRVGGRVEADVDADRAFGQAGARGRRGRSSRGSGHGRRGRRAGPCGCHRDRRSRRRGNRVTVRRMADDDAGRLSAALRRLRPQRRALGRRSTPNWRPASPPTTDAHRAAPRRAGRPAPARAAVRVRALACCCDDPQRPARRVVSEPDGGTPTVRRDPTPSRRFVRAHDDELRSLLGTRATQTNEIGRCVAVPAGVRDARRRVWAARPHRRRRQRRTQPARRRDTTTTTNRVAPSARPTPSVRLHVPHRGGGARADRAPAVRGRRRPRPPTRSTSVTPTRRGGWRRASGPTRSSASIASRRRSRSPGRSASSCAGATPSPTRRR